MLTKTLFAVSFMSLNMAAPLNKRQSGSQTCGSDRYTASQISSAASRACTLISEGEEAGSSKYPEKYNDYEGFGFGGASKPYYEFPILESGTYNGGSPGADRVIVSTSGSCRYVGLITHSGADDNDFVACSGTS